MRTKVNDLPVVSGGLNVSSNSGLHDVRVVRKFYVYFLMFSSVRIMNIYLLRALHVLLCGRETQALRKEYRLRKNNCI